VKSRVNFVAAVLVVALIAPAVLSAGNHENRDRVQMTSSKELADHLARFESKSIELRREIGELKMYKYESSKKHAVNDRLNVIKQIVNDLGTKLAAMEAMKGQGSTLQQHAIAAARPHLAALASETNDIIELVNQRESWATAPEFKEIAWAMYGHVDSLYRTVDTIIDYSAARARLEGLNMPPTGALQ
jgi:hypothetical protein